MRRRRSPRVTVDFLARRVIRIERRLRKLEGKSRRIGFRVTECLGDREEQDPDWDEENLPDET